MTPTITRGARRGSTASVPTLLLAVTRAGTSGVASNRSPSAADTGVIRQLAKITPNHSLLIFPSGTESARRMSMWDQDVTNATSTRAGLAVPGLAFGLFETGTICSVTRPLAGGPFA